MYNDVTQLSAARVPLVQAAATKSAPRDENIIPRVEVRAYTCHSVFSYRVGSQCSSWFSRGATRRHARPITRFSCRLEAKSRIAWKRMDDRGNNLTVHQSRVTRAINDILDKKQLGVVGIMSAGENLGKLIGIE